MHFPTASLATLVALVVSFANANPLPATDASLLPQIDILNYSWHAPTATDLAILASNGSYASDEQGLPISLSGLNKRQSGVYRTNSALVGNGNPHQNPYQQQVTQTLRCGPGAGCSASISKTHSLSWTASANAAYGWISGGFSVSESYSTGRTYTCNGNAGGDVCVWYSYGVTAYTVSATTCYYYQGRPSMCRNQGTRILYSPNKCQQGSPYCVRGSACRSENQGYYVKDNAPAGGPPC